MTLIPTPPRDLSHERLVWFDPQMRPIVRAPLTLSLDEARALRAFASDRCMPLAQAMAWCVEVLRVSPPIGAGRIAHFLHVAGRLPLTRATVTDVYRYTVREDEVDRMALMLRPWVEPCSRTSPA
jgi:hypothetical protein